MTAFVSMRSLAGASACLNLPDQWVAVLTAYFDDSGTHAGSDVTAIGGLIGLQEDWSRFELEWKRALDHAGIKRMHLAHCNGKRGEFKDWSYQRRSELKEKLFGIISSYGLLVFFSVVSDIAWVEACKREPVLSDIFPSKLDFCFNTCMQGAIRSRIKGRSDKVAAVFDTREQELPRWRPIGSKYEDLYPNVIDHYAFGTMEKVLPLQAADCVANSVFSFMCVTLRNGIEPEQHDFITLTSGMSARGGFHTEDQLVKYVNDLRAG